MPICIAGMHRAGTSMVARLLHLSGLYLGPESDISLTAEDNPEGFWENIHFVRLNNAILACLGGGWDVPPSMPDDWDLAPRLLPLRAQAAELLQQFESHEPWGWKDPRNSLTLAFWKRLLPSLKVVICLRSPLEVARSLHKRGYASNAFAFNLWSTYYTRLLAVVRPEDRVITHYDAYFHDAPAELRRVLDLLGMQYTEETIARACTIRSEALRHNSGTLPELLSAEVPDELLKLYLDMCAEAGPVYQLAMQADLGTDDPTLVLQALRPEQREALRQLRLQAKIAESKRTIAALQAQAALREQTERALREQVAARDQALARMRTERAQWERQVEQLRARVAEGEQAQREVEAIKSSTAFQLVTSVVWPLSSRFIPPALRGRIKNVLRGVKRSFFRQAPAEGLIWATETDLSRPFTTGAGNVFYLNGWCYHPTHKIRRLSILVDGVPHRVANYGFARPDVLNAQDPRNDPTGNSLMSGFWAAIPFEQVAASSQARLALRAVLDNRKRCETPMATLTLTPFRRDPVNAVVQSDAQTAGQPLVAICMATYNSPLDLFAKQIDSIIDQTHQNWICIINDDCSDQDIFEEIQRIAAKDLRFLVHQNAARLGFYHNFERCLARVPDVADFVAFADHDDYWYPDKLATCLAAFRADTTLVYSDMDIVTREGQIVSHTYWTTRRNNYTDLEVLFFANTVTGAASLFRASLLREILPFPELLGEVFHDHWVACVALTSGTIRYIDRPLYAYRQHSNNVIGHYVVPDYQLLPQHTTPLRWFGRLVLSKANLIASLIPLRYIYFHFFMNIILRAKVLRLRIADLPPEKRQVLDRFCSFETSLPALIVQAIKYKQLRRPTLGHELYCLRGAIGYRLFNLYYRLRRPRLLRQRLAAPEAAHPAIQHDVSELVDFLTSKVAPLKLDIAEHARRRVNVLISTVDFRYLFAGYVGMLNLALHIRRHGYNTRIVIVDSCEYDPPAWKRELARYEGFENLLDLVETAYVYDRSTALEVSPNDAFVATSWWTAHIAHRAVRLLGQEKFLFFVQEYEPLFYPSSSLYTLAEEAYRFPHDAVFSTEILRDYFRQNRLGVFQDGNCGERESIFIQNAVSSFSISVPELQRRKARKLLFYARPEQHAARNMFELGVLALQAALEEGHFDGHVWEFHGIGGLGSYKSLPLYRDIKLQLLPKVSWQEYLKLLPSYDLGLSLMLTPHPSMVPLDMAAAGLVTVTNTFANKTSERLARISPNIIAAPPTIEGVKEGLIAALGEVEHFEKRVAGARINWSTSWDETFNNAVMARIEAFLGR